MSNTTKYGIIGAGKVGLSIAELLFAKGELSFIFDINPKNIPDIYNNCSYSLISELPQCDFIYIAVSDTAIQPLSVALSEEYHFAEHAVFAHSSGVKSAIELSDLNSISKGTAAIHPFQTFAYADKSNLEDISWGIECPDSIWNNCIEFVQRLGGDYCRLEYGNLRQKALYHCSAVMSSNNMTTLLQAGRLIADEAGIPAKQFISPITQKTLDNNIIAFENNTIPLTGPIARADAKAIHTHIKALEDNSLIRIYCYNALATLELSLREKIITTTDYHNIKYILESELTKTNTQL